MPVFRNDDDGFIGWSARNPTGYVLNLRENEPAMIHRADCGHLSPWEPRWGVATKKPKVCAVDRGDVEAGAAATPGIDDRTGAALRTAPVVRVRWSAQPRW